MSNEGMSDQDNTTALVETWRTIIQDEGKSWVLFENGTCLILSEPQENLTEQALKIMGEWGPVNVASAAGSFKVTKLQDKSGWIVTGHYPDMLNYVGPEDLRKGNSSDLIIGLLGRGKRESDAQSLNIIHVEDKRV